MFPTADDQLVRYNPVVPASKIPLLDAAVYAKCDAIDGLKDGQITNPLACKFDPMTNLPLCKAGQDQADCFTVKQATVIAQIHQGPSNAAGQIMPGYAYGGENVAGMWAPPTGGGNAYIIGSAPKVGANNPYASRHYLLTNETLKYLIYNDPGYDLHSFNFDTDLPGLQAIAAEVDANNPDLSAFHKRGGKLIMTVGWADAAVGALVVKGFYDDMVAANGGLAATQTFARLFMLPGVGHCFVTDPARKTPHIVDLLSALEDWVEKGAPPERLIAAHTAGGGRDPPESMPIAEPVDRTRPICAYPAMAVYDGKGDVDKAESFACRSS
jgi:feruloyl esterase